MAMVSIPLKRPPFRQSAKRSWAAKLTLLTAIGVLLDAAPTFQLSSAPFSLFAKQPAAARGGFVSGRTVGWDLGFQQMGSRTALAADYNSMKLAELKEICKGKGLPVSGTKPVLIARIEEAEGAEGAATSEKKSGKDAAKAKSEKPKKPAESEEPEETEETSDEAESEEPEKPASKAPAEKPPEKTASMAPAGKPRNAKSEEPKKPAESEEPEETEETSDEAESEEPEKPASKAPAEKPPEKTASMAPAGKPRSLGYEPGTKVAITPGLTTDRNRGVIIEPGDRVMARYHRDHRMYAGIVLDIQDHKDAYLISWDEPDQYEPLSSCKEVQLTSKAKKKLEGGEKQLFHVGDKVQVRYPMDNSWYDADITGVGRVEREEWEIKWKDPDGTPPVQIKVAKDIHLVRRAKHACQ
eukprot:TRINITY_DN412_c0_g1_i1.p1 TRINITY_DN412_c0_g1~~TRINITY_DN412_c0_g1_i1.p1  ORF type:complete len:411 (+),score=109.43 TRINITY_DN412_c0_g1_i1:154-1386(+)